MGDYGPDAGSTDPNRGPQGSVEWNVVKQPGFYGWPYCIRENVPYKDITYTANNGAGTVKGDYNCAAPVNDSPNNTGLTNLPPAHPGVDVDGLLRDRHPVPGPRHGRRPDGRHALLLRRGRRTPTPSSRGSTTASGSSASGTTTGSAPRTSTTRDSSPACPTGRAPRATSARWTWSSARTARCTSSSGARASREQRGLGRLPGRLHQRRAHTDRQRGGEQRRGAGRHARCSSPPPAPTTRTAPTSPTCGTSATARRRRPRPNPSHTYTAAGTYDATLTVTDESGATAVDTVRVVVGNQRPVVTIELPGERQDRRLRRQDPVQDLRRRSGRRLDRCRRAAQIRIEVKLGHDTHAHELVHADRLRGRRSRSPAWTATASTRTCSRSSRPATRTRATARRRRRHRHAPRRSCSPSSSRPSTSLTTGRTADGRGTGDPGVVNEATTDVGGGNAAAFIEDGDWISFNPYNLEDLTKVDLPRGLGAARAASSSCATTRPTARSWRRRRTSPRPAAGRRGRTSRSTCRRPSRRARIACSSCSVTRRPPARC